MDIESLTATPCTKHILEIIENAPINEGYLGKTNEFLFQQLGAALDYGLLVFTYRAIQTAFS